ncbi:serine hydrolase domain-containing protein [Paracoccus sp. (in: a-proteobacteria)]|uniref:serine hydrolase domain-containing protein n=1 Tax=Paracoccus sp. TaxID=267 RepID=UPI00272B7AEF|nr:serine hydrolase [Paracoccus sp. (in: a-proteobacteria)]
MSALFDRARDEACAAECAWPRDLRAVIESCSFDPPPWNVVLGPVSDRGAASGTVMQDGRSMSAWGPCDRADMAFSVTKSYIGLLAALALDRGLIADFDEPVSARIGDEAFADARNRRVTWRHLLDQTSEWGGTLFGIPHSVDRDRQLAPTEDGSRMNRATPLQQPGSYWDYNDTRVNALCLALTLLFGQPLPAILAGLHPAFADRSRWHWDGYGSRSTIPLNGAAVEIVVGGGHWGGGMVAAVDHHLALGGIFLGGGQHDGHRAVTPEALEALLRPCPLQPVYGGLWWLNDRRRLYPDLPGDSVLAMGVGANVIWVCPSLGLVACLRWLRPDAVAPVLGQLAEAAERGSA